MHYRKFTDTEISPLGFGCMRFPTKDGNPNSKNIDEEKSIEMLRYAIDHGVNYLDTAYPYHDHYSEVLVGKALKDGYRQKTKIATKCPVWVLKTEQDFDRILAEQLEKLGTDTIDFYLLHALDKNRWKDIVLKFDLLSKLDQAKADGRIGHIGFSFHDDLDTFKMIVDANPHWEFCQIQLNYINTDYQAGLAGLEYASQKGLSVVIMEPLLGGKLAAPPIQVQKILPSEKEPVEWALDFLWNRPEVGVILSGMGTLEQVCQNIAYANAASVGMLSAQDLDMLQTAKKTFDTMALVPCTKCSYCMPCPFGLDIPKIYEAYNQTASLGLKKAKQTYSALTVQADACKKCGKCEKVCPQNIISHTLMPEIAGVFAK